MPDHHDSSLPVNPGDPRDPQKPVRQADPEDALGDLMSDDELEDSGGSKPPVPEPSISASFTSWADVVQQNMDRSVVESSAQERLSFDAVSDQDILSSISAEEAADILRLYPNASSTPAAPPQPPPATLPPQFAAPNMPLSESMLYEPDEPVGSAPSPFPAALNKPAPYSPLNESIMYEPEEPIQRPIPGDSAVFTSMSADDDFSGDDDGSQSSHSILMENEPSVGQSRSVDLGSVMEDEELGPVEEGPARSMIIRGFDLPPPPPPEIARRQYDIPADPPFGFNPESLPSQAAARLDDSLEGSADLWANARSTDSMAEEQTSNILAEFMNREEDSPASAPANPITRSESDIRIDLVGTEDEPPIVPTAMVTIPQLVPMVGLDESISDDSSNRLNAEEMPSDITLGKAGIDSSADPLANPAVSGMIDLEDPQLLKAFETMTNPTVKPATPSNRQAPSPLEELDDSALDAARVFLGDAEKDESDGDPLLEALMGGGQQSDNNLAGSEDDEPALILNSTNDSADSSNAADVLLEALDTPSEFDAGNSHILGRAASEAEINPDDWNQGGDVDLDNPRSIGTMQPIISDSGSMNTQEADDILAAAQREQSSSVDLGSDPNPPALGMTDLSFLNPPAPPQPSPARNKFPTPSGDFAVPGLSPASGVIPPSAYNPAIPGASLSNPSTPMLSISGGGMTGVSQMPSALQMPSMLMPPPEPPTAAKYGNLAIGLFVGTLLGLASFVLVWSQGLLDPPPDRVNSDVAGIDSKVKQREEEARKKKEEEEARKRDEEARKKPPEPKRSLQQEAILQAILELSTGQPERAVETLKPFTDNPPAIVLKTRGRARWLALNKKLASGERTRDQPIAETEGEVQEALKDLDQAIRVYEAQNMGASQGAQERFVAEALLWKGVILESVGNFKAASEVYSEGQNRFKEPKNQRIFFNAKKRLELTTTNEEQKPIGLLPNAREAYVSAVILSTLLQTGSPADEPEEAGYLFWDALGVSRTNLPDRWRTAARLMNQAIELHRKLRRLRTTPGVNPLSDPREEIFERAGEILVQYWNLRQQLESEPRFAKLMDSKGIEGAIKELLETKAEPKVDLAMSQMVEKLKTDLKTADEKFLVLNEKYAAAAKSLKDVGVDDPDLVKGIARLADEKKELAETVNLVVEKLKTAKFLPDKADSDALLTAIDTALAKAAAGMSGGSSAFLGTALVAANKSLNDLKADLAKKETALKSELARAEKLQADLVAEVEKGKEIAAKLEKAQADLVALEKLSDAAKKEIAVAKMEADTVKKDAAAMIEKAKKDIDTLMRDLVESRMLAKTLLMQVEDSKKTQIALSEELAKVKKAAAKGVAAPPLELWIALLGGDYRGDTTAALADAELILKDETAADDAKAKALAVKALVAKRKGDFSAAREVLAEVLKHPGFAKDQPWAKLTADTELALRTPTLPMPPVKVDPIAQVDTTLKMFPAEQFPMEHAQLLTKRGLLKLDGGDAEGAAADIEAAVKVGAAAPEVRLAVAKLAEKKGDPETAIKGYREVIAENPENVEVLREARVGLARMLLKKVPENKTPNVGSGSRMQLPVAGTVLLTTMLKFEQDDDPALQEALEQAEELIKLKEPRGHILKAEVLSRLGKFDEAFREYARGLEGLKALGMDDVGTLSRIVERQRKAILATPAPKQIDPPPMLPKKDDPPPMPPKKDDPPPMLPKQIDPPPMLTPNYPKLSMPPIVGSDPIIRARQLYADGLDFFFAQRYSEAERLFSEATNYDNLDARYFYYLGMARLAQGNDTGAKSAFAIGANLERLAKPAPRDINAGLERVQGPLRRTLTQYRP